MANKTKHATNEGGEMMRQTVCNRCGNIIPEMTKKEYKKIDYPNGYNITLVGINCEDGRGWTGHCGHLCEECYDEIFGTKVHKWGKHDC